MSKIRPIINNLSCCTKVQCYNQRNLQCRLFTRNIYDFYNKKKEFRDRKLIGFSREQMFEIVSDVGHYKDFVPFCRKSLIVDKKTEEYMQAKLEIGFPPVIESYTSHVTLAKPYLVRAINRDGQLFDYLKTEWKFNPGLHSNPQSCIIDFHVCFEFKTIFHSSLAHMFFDRVVKQMEAAFFEEAKRRHGQASLISHRLKAVSQHTNS